jgi:transposase InsO family protein
MLEGRPFTIYTDHKPLTQALHRSSEPWTARQCRQLSYVAEFTSDVRHVAGVDNVVANTLSRLPPCQPGQTAAAASGPVSTLAVVDATTSRLDYAAIAAHQQDRPEVAAMARFSSLRVRPVVVEDVELLCNVSTGAVRPLIPTADREAVFQAFHSLAHAGTRATRRLMSARVVWRRMAVDITRWCRDCQQCQRGKVTVQAKSAVQPISIPPQRFHHVHVDIVGPLPASTEGYVYLLTMIDRTTRWLEAAPMKNMDAVTCANTLVATWIARYGVPALLTSDRGTQFASAVWQVLCSRLGIQQIFTTAYHPQSNGMIERAHRQLKDSLRSCLAGPQWPEHLPKKTALRHRRNWCLALRWCCQASSW